MTPSAGQRRCASSGQRDPVHAGSEIEIGDQDMRHTGGARQGERILRERELGHVEPGLRQRLGDVPAQGFILFDQQNVHGASLPELLAHSAIRRTGIQSAIMQ